MKVVISKKAIKEYIKEMLTAPGWESIGQVGSSPASVSAVVDPSAAETDPWNPNFKPRNRMELRAALPSFLDSISDADAPQFYDALKDAVESTENKEEDMKKNEKSVEEIVRLAVRKMLKEAGPYADTGMSYSGPAGGSSSRAGFDECEACEGEGYLKSGAECKVCKGTGEVPSKGRKNVMMTDVGGASFKEIADEMGYATESGAKQAVDRILAKAKFISNLPKEEEQILVLTAMNDYIEELKKSGELTAADVELLKNHPQIVSELEGFREHLSVYIKRAMKEQGQGE